VQEAGECTATDCCF